MSKLMEYNTLKILPGLSYEHLQTLTLIFAELKKTAQGGVDWVIPDWLINLQNAGEQNEQ